MTQQLLIQNGTLITPQGEIEADLRIVDERIQSIGLELVAQPGEEVIDARGCVVLPGLVDPHTHIQLDTGIYKTPDDWAVGTRTAACGGVTTVIDFATQFPGQDVRQAVANRLDEVNDVAHIDFGLHVMLTELPESDAVLDEWMADLARLGTPAAKVYTTYRPNYYQSDDGLLRVFKAAARHGVVVMIHCENDDLVSAETARLVQANLTGLAYHGQARPPLAEVEAVSRVLFLAREAGCPVYIVHCSVARSVEQVVAARGLGQIAFAETCPQYLLLDESQYVGPHAAWGIMQPPLRPACEPDRLWQLVSSGAVSSLGTDHCDYTILQKLGLEPLEQPAVQQAMAQLSAEEREIVILRTGLRDGWHREWDEVSRALGISRDAVRRLETDAVRRLREAEWGLERDPGLHGGQRPSATAIYKNTRRHPRFGDYVAALGHRRRGGWAVDLVTVGATDLGQPSAHFRPVPAQRCAAAGQRCGCRHFRPQAKGHDQGCQLAQHSGLHAIREPHPARSGAHDHQPGPDRIQGWGISGPARRGSVCRRAEVRRKPVALTGLV